MHRAIHTLLLFSLFFASMDGAIDIAKSGHPHGDAAIQQVENSGVGSSSGLQGHDDGGRLTPSHCEHCCHGHAFVVLPNADAAQYLCGAIPHRPFITASILNFSQAPPTPPPNA